LRSANNFLEQSHRLQLLLSHKAASFLGDAMTPRQVLIAVKLSLLAMGVDARLGPASKLPVDLRNLQAQIRTGYEKVETLLASDSPTEKAAQLLMDHLVRLMPLVTAETPVV
jgi:hypothetical protein